MTFFLVLLVSLMNSWYLRPRPVLELRRSSPIASAVGGCFTATEVSVAARCAGRLLLTLRLTGSGG